MNYLYMNRTIIQRGLLTLLLALPLVTSCKKEEERAIIEAPSAPQALKASASAIVLERSNLASQVLTLEWKPATFSYEKALASYTLVITRPSATGSEVKTVELPLGSVARKTFIGDELNKILAEELKVAAKVAHTYELRLKAYPAQIGGVPSSSLPANTVSLSAPITVTITAADLVREDLYFVGSMFGVNNWNINYTGFPLFSNNTKSNAYTYTGKFKAGEFKLVTASNIGSWNTLFGSTETGKLTLQGGDTNIKDITAEGYYTFEVTPEHMAYTLVPFNAGSYEVYTKMALIGTAVGGWDADKVILTPTTYDPHIWKTENVQLSEGEFKFRANSDWGKSWGKKSDTFPISKIGDGGDDNIRVSANDAGTYDVIFNDLTKHFHFKRK